MFPYIGIIFLLGACLPIIYGFRFAGLDGQAIVTDKNTHLFHFAYGAKATPFTLAYVATVGQADPAASEKDWKAATSKAIQADVRLWNVLKTETDNTGRLELSNILDMAYELAKQTVVCQAAEKKDVKQVAGACVSKFLAGLKVASDAHGAIPALLGG